MIHVYVFTYTSFIASLNKGRYTKILLKQLIHNSGAHRPSHKSLNKIASFMTGTSLRFFSEASHNSGARCPPLESFNKRCFGEAIQ